MSSAQARQPAGVPVGGQFAATARAETGPTLTVVPDEAPAPAAPPRLTRAQEKAIETLFSNGSLHPNYFRDSRSLDGAEVRVVNTLVDAGLAKWAPYNPGGGVLPYVVPSLDAPTQVSPGVWRVELPPTVTPRHGAAMVTGAWRRGQYDGRRKNSWDWLPSRARQVGTTDDGRMIVEIEATGRGYRPEA